jgi:hypothetical protein
MDVVEEQLHQQKGLVTEGSSKGPWPYKMIDKPIKYVI